MVLQFCWGCLGVRQQLTALPASEESSAAGAKHGGDSTSEKQGWSLGVGRRTGGATWTGLQRLVTSPT